MSACSFCGIPSAQIAPAASVLPEAICELLLPCLATQCLDSMVAGHFTCPRNLHNVWASGAARLVALLVKAVWAPGPWRPCCLPETAKRGRRSTAAPTSLELCAVGARDRSYAVSSGISRVAALRRRYSPGCTVLHFLKARRKALGS